MFGFSPWQRSIWQDPTPESPHAVAFTTLLASGNAAFVRRPGLPLIDQMRMQSIQMTSEEEMANAFSALACMASSDAAQEPAAAYEEFVAAVARRDVQSVLARMSDDYAKNLRLNRHSRSFATFFQLWCENFPQHVEVSACFVDGDSAILETRVEHAGAALAGRVTLELEGDAWRVGSERCADGRTRIPTGRSSRSRLT